MEPQNQPVSPVIPTVTAQPATPPASGAAGSGQAVAPQPIDPATIKYAGFGRLAALIIDGLIAGALSTPMALVLAYNFARNDPNPTIFMGNVIDVMIIIYYILFGTLYGATPGKMILKMKIVDGNYAKPSFLRILLRETVGKWVTALLIIVSGLFVIFHKQKRGLHDLIASTYVIYK